MLKWRRRKLARKPWQGELGTAVEHRHFINLAGKRRRKRRRGRKRRSIWKAANQSNSEMKCALCVRWAKVSNREKQLDGAYLASSRQSICHRCQWLISVETPPSRCMLHMCMQSMCKQIHTNKLILFVEFITIVKALKVWCQQFGRLRHVLVGSQWKKTFSKIPFVNGPELALEK